MPNAGPDSLTVGPRRMAFLDVTHSFVEASSRQTNTESGDDNPGEPDRFHSQSIRIPGRIEQLIICQFYIVNGEATCSGRMGAEHLVGLAPVDAGLVSTDQKRRDAPRAGPRVHSDNQDERRVTIKMRI
jgi:hypothetical protein